MTTGILCAVRGAAETEVVQALDGSTRLSVTRRCADLAELLGAAAAGLGRVAVVSVDLPGLDRSSIDHLHGSATLVVAVAADRPDRPPDHALHLGADAVVSDSAVVGEIVPAVLALLDTPTVLVPGRSVEGRGAHRAPDPSHRDSAGTPGTGNGPIPPEDDAAHPDGRVVAVWGPTGAPGRSTVALNLAAELAEPTRVAGRGAILIDADTYGGTIAQMLGLLDEAPGVAAAARAAANGRLDVAALAALTPVLDGGLRVLTGISRADRWPQVPSSGLQVVWRAARRLAAWTVVDCGFNLEQDEMLSYDTRAPGRNEATLAALAEADTVVVVGGGDPIALQRLVRGLGALDEAVGAVPSRRVVVNRVRASASGPRPVEAIRQALQRYAGVTEVHVVPEDRATVDGAVLAARTLREHAPGSAVRQAIRELAELLTASRVAAAG